MYIFVTFVICILLVVIFILFANKVKPPEVLKILVMCRVVSSDYYLARLTAGYCSYYPVPDIWYIPS